MPDERGLPTPDELAKLPRRAVVAFAARCARRAQPLFAAEWAAPRDFLEAIDRAIGLAESFAAAAKPAYDAAKAAANAAADAADVAANVAANVVADAAPKPAYFAAIAGANAAAAAAAAKFADVAANVANAAANVAYAAANADTVTDVASAAAHAAAVYANSAYAADTVDVATSGVLRDFVRLRAAAQTENWTNNDTPVPPEFFGPMWPDGEPEGWPKSTQSESTPQQIDEVSPPLISILWDPEVVTEDEYADLVEALGNVVRAHGGAGLKRIDSTGFGVEIESGVLS